jgi:hypothetical protein
VRTAVRINTHDDAEVGTEPEYAPDPLRSKRKQPLACDHDLGGGVGLFR